MVSRIVCGIVSRAKTTSAWSGGVCPRRWREYPERIGYLHIDLNSPPAEVAVIERLFDLVVPGGVMVFDDYGWKVLHRQKEDAFMRACGYEVLELPAGQGLVVKH